jgi:hypothetical protein
LVQAFQLFPCNAISEAPRSVTSDIGIVFVLIRKVLVRLLPSNLSPSAGRDLALRGSQNPTLEARVYSYTQEFELFECANPIYTEMLPVA